MADAGPMRTKTFLTCLSALVVLGLTVVPLAGAKGLKVRNGVVHACLKTKGKKSERGTIHVVNSARQCKKRKGERPLTWALGSPHGATTGPAGPSGPGGPAGPQGASGAQGPTGAAGQAAQAAVVDTLKETISSQGKEIEVLLGKIASLETVAGGLTTTTDTLTASLKETCQQVGAVGEGLETTGTALTSLATHLTTVNVLGIPIVGLGEVPPAPPVLPELDCG